VKLISTVIPSWGPTVKIPQGGVREEPDRRADLWWKGKG